MSRSGRGLVAGLLLCGLVGAAPVWAGSIPLTTVRIYLDTSEDPLFVTHPPGDFERLFFLTQDGRVLIQKDGVMNATPFLDIDAISSCCFERGLLGMAFHPDYANNGQFYVSYTNNAGDSIIAKYLVSADPDLADDTSADQVLFADQPFSNHNGGWIGFGPDGYLYVAFGDGGDACDPGQRAQDITDQLLGKMLRIDVNGDDFPDDDTKDYAIPADNPFVGITGDDEIWAYGLRNPWRPSFDRETGDFYIADVGQGVWEEINFQPAGDAGGQNYGWDCMEGNHCSSGSGCGAGACVCFDASLTIPIQEFQHTGGNCSVTGGYVYRGCAIPELQGTYFYADYCSAKIWSFRYVDGSVTDFTDRTSELAPGGGMSIGSITSFGEDAYGELYITDQGGEIYKIVRDDGALSSDCNENSVEDGCEVLDGSAADDNGNGIPDDCEVPISIIASDPPNDAIDARQPSEPDGTAPAGWMTLTLTFDGDAAALTPGDFSLSEAGGDGVPPNVIAVNLLTPDTVMLVFDVAIEPVTWTTITHTASATSVRLGYLPADVNGDGTSAAPDLLALIDYLNGITALPDYSTDVDRTGLPGASDVLREVDLLNGAGVYDPFLGVSLP